MPSRRDVLAGTAAASLGAVAGCSTPFGDAVEVRGKWPAFGYDERNVGYERDGTAPPDRPRRLWTFETASRNVGPAAVSERTAFHVVGRRLYALDRLDGTIRWKTPVGTWGSEAPTLVDGTLYLGWSGGVRAVDAASGDVSWTFEIAGGVWSPPARHGGTVIAARDAGRGAGAVLGLRDGSEAWRYEFEAGTASGPTVVDGTAYLGTWTMPRGNEEDENVAALRSVLAVSLDDGTEAWRFTEPRGNASVPAVADDRVYVACGDDHLYAVDATGGTRRWRTEIPLAPTSPPAVVDGTVYAASTDGHVYAVDAGSGEVAYRVDAGAPLEAGLAVVDEVNEESQYEGWRQRLVYAGTVEETLAVVKTDSRSVRSTVDLGAPVAGPPAVRDRLVHVGTDDGNVHVLGE